MADSRWNTYRGILHREIQGDVSQKFQYAAHVTPDLIRRLGLEEELVGHEGCVNCLTWNEEGTLLASGSDDLKIIIWNPFQYRIIKKIPTSHNGNIFSVKFLHGSNDHIMLSGAADSKIDVRDVNTCEALHTFSCHGGRVKRLATAPQEPALFWSASEDGTVRQFDLRDPEVGKIDGACNVLVNLNNQVGMSAEVKCLSINPYRAELLAVGANDPYVRLYDRRMLHCSSFTLTRGISVDGRYRYARRSQTQSPQRSTDSANVESRLPKGCVRYFIAGHLPQKQHDYRKRFRSLACTYLTFSPCGGEILVNLGGEQMYLFDINQSRPAQNFSIPVSTGSESHKPVLLQSDSGENDRKLYTESCVDLLMSDVSETRTNGVNKHVTSSLKTSNGSNGFSAPASACIRDRARYYGKPLPEAVEAIKQKANAVFEMEKYNQAILLYNQAIHMSPDLPILYGNRAAAYLKRNWDGDVYAALRDCHTAIQLDDKHIKAHFRLARCLYLLSRYDEALECLTRFKERFSEHASSNTCQSLEKDVQRAISSKAAADKKRQSSTSSGRESESGGEEGEEKVGGMNLNSLSEQELEWRGEASDYELRYCGHCNTTTDIKEANYFGSNGQYIVAGSDDGSFFIWDKVTTNIVRILRGDESIVNCLAPHPSACFMATSGIDPVVRLWSPRPEDGKKEEREVDNSDDAATANQRRMNADPLEIMLLNMGYRLSGALIEPEGEGGGGQHGEGDQGDRGLSVANCRSS